jgi:hypothetical protein
MLIRSLLKTSFYAVQLLVCLLLIFEKMQPTRFPTPSPVGRLPARHSSSYKPARYRMKQRPRRPALSWRRLLFLLS